MKEAVNFFWLRRDLRLHDNSGLFHALRSGKKVQCVFIFDRNILNKLDDKKDARVLFIHNRLKFIQKELSRFGSSLLVVYSTPHDAWTEWISKYRISKIFTNHDYEPYAMERDSDLQKFFASKGIEFNTFKDHVVFEKNEITKDDGKPYTVFTPYKNKWLKKIDQPDFKSFPSENHFDNFLAAAEKQVPSMKEIGFVEFDYNFPSTTVPQHVLKEYANKRDFPSEDGTSRLSVHLRFGSVSIRELVQKAISEKSDTWLNELIWRDFYQMILWHFPYVASHAFKPAYDHIPWRNNESEFEKWCDGNTGYPIVDAGMRELNNTGFMHNRVRMITASFLTKHLLIDWRWGEAYFAKKLTDFDLASNNGGWQWAAGSGCDAAPYFRIFNPYEQTRKFDPDFKYIKKWVPEFEDFSYPAPIVDHKFARERCLDVYKKALNKLHE